MIEFNEKMSNKELTQYIKEHGFPTRVAFAKHFCIPITTLKKWGAKRVVTDAEPSRVPTYVKGMCEYYLQTQQKILALEEEITKLKKSIQ